MLPKNQGMFEKIRLDEDREKNMRIIDRYIFFSIYCDLDKHDNRKKIFLGRYDVLL